jgi:NAD(P)-dependent dehydrogenase (short-subunit alcohol dehydrogenase family)
VPSLRGVRRRGACGATASSLSELGACIAVPGDISSESGCQALARLICNLEPRIDVLINYAGATWSSPLEDLDELAWNRVLSVNLQGVFHLTKYLLSVLRLAGTLEQPARVINIGSVEALHVPPLEMYAYSTSKAAVHQLTRHLAKALAPTIIVNAIAPGPFVTKIMKRTLENMGQEISDQAPLKRIGRPTDIAGSSIFLASAAAAHITGAVLGVEGGIGTLA